MPRRLLFWKNARKPPVPLQNHFLDVGDWKRPHSALRPLFLFNLVSLIALGTAVSWAILYFTSWFPELGGLLALGGLLSWLAFVFRLIPSETGKELQDRFAAVLDSVLALCLILLIAVVLWRLTAPYGSIRIEAHQSAVPREAWVYRDKLEAPVGLSSDGESNILVEAAAEPPLHLKIAGYPAITAHVSPRRRALMVFPQSFRRPLVLVAPSAQLIRDKAEMPSAQHVTLGVTVRDNQHRPVVALTINDYAWFPFWVGCAGDVIADDSVRAQLNAISSQVSDQRKAPFARSPESRPDWYCKGCSGWEILERELPEQGEVELIMYREKVTVGTQTVSLLPQGGGLVQVILLAPAPFQSL